MTNLAESLKALGNVDTTNAAYDPETEFRNRSELLEAAAANPDVGFSTAQLELISTVSLAVVAAIRAGIDMAERSGHRKEDVLATSANDLVYNGIAAVVTDSAFERGLRKLSVPREAR